MARFSHESFCVCRANIYPSSGAQGRLCPVRQPLPEEPLALSGGDVGHPEENPLISHKMAPARAQCFGFSSHQETNMEGTRANSTSWEEVGFFHAQPFCMRVRPRSWGHLLQGRRWRGSNPRPFQERSWEALGRVLGEEGESSGTWSPVLSCWAW